MAHTDPPNADQCEFWNGEGGRAWLEYHHVIDRLNRPLHRALMTAAAPNRGERVIDIGCGCGETAMESANAVGPQGRVLGIDLSEMLIDEANKRAGECSAAGPVTFVAGDAATYDFSDCDADLALSRFGVMFFDDPVAAFRNIRRGLRPTGRLVFLCWQDKARSDFYNLPLAAALKQLPTPDPVPPHAPGPFAFADPGYTRDTLEKAGFTDVVCRDVGAELIMPDLGGAHHTADFFMELGPVRRLAAEAAAPVQAAVRREIALALEPRRTGEGYRLDVAAWIVLARSK